MGICEASSESLNGSTKPAQLQLHKQPQHFIDNELRPNAEVFERVLEPDPARPARYRLLKGLHQLDNQDWQPPAIKFMVDHHANDAGVDQFLKRLDRLAYFLFITRANVNERLLRYAALLSGIEADTALADDSALELSDPEKLGLRTMLDGDVYLNQRTRRPILLRLDGMLSDSTAHYDHSLVTIVHVSAADAAGGKRMGWRISRPRSCATAGFTVWQTSCCFLNTRTRPPAIMTQ